MEPLPGALDFLAWLRERFQVLILSDTFYPFARPLMRKLGHPTLFAHDLEIEPSRPDRQLPPAHARPEEAERAAAPRPELPGDRRRRQLQRHQHAVGRARRHPVPSAGERRRRIPAVPGHDGVRRARARVRRRRAPRLRPRRASPYTAPRPRLDEEDPPMADAPLVRQPGSPIRKRKDGTLEVPDNPTIAFVEGDGTGRDIWKASVRVFDAAVAEGLPRPPQDRLVRGARGREGVQAHQELAARRDGRQVPLLPGRDQGPAHDTDRRRHPQPQRRAAPDPRPVRVPAAGALVRGRAQPREAPRARRHGDLPREHGRHLRGHRVEGRLGRSQEDDRLPAEADEGEDHPLPRDQRHRREARLAAGNRAAGARRARLRDRAQAQVGDPGAQGQHHEVHRGRVPRLGLQAGRRRSTRAARSAGTTATASRPTARCW